MFVRRKPAHLHALDACCVLCVVVAIVHIEKNIYLVISVCNVVCRLVGRAYVKWFTGTRSECSAVSCNAIV